MPLRLSSSVLFFARHIVLLGLAIRGVRNTNFAETFRLGYDSPWKFVVSDHTFVSVVLSAAPIGYRFVSVAKLPASNSSNSDLFVIEMGDGILGVDTMEFEMHRYDRCIFRNIIIEAPIMTCSRR